MDLQFPIAAITDEFSPDLAKALPAMKAIGMTGAELRVVSGKNIMDLTDEELSQAIHQCRDAGMEIISIASPVLKCILPGAPDLDTRFQQDAFGSKHTFEDQPRLAERAFEIAKRTGAKIIRVFSYWRTQQPEKCFDAIVSALADLAEKAKKHNVIIGLENEHACNVGTGSEAARILKALDHPNLKLVWDPANCLVAGENPFPEGYRALPPGRIVHVHAKDCRIENGKVIWSVLGTQQVDWKGQLAALAVDGYKGWISLETHWPGPGGDKMQASTICGWNLRSLCSA
jgi:sugar phosphate isomerase/epimerase